MGYKVTTSWSGRWPNLCSGTWSLEINGEDMSRFIPRRLISSPMRTYGTYQRFHFESGWNEVWETYDDGLKEPEWIHENLEWLLDITCKRDEMHLIYEAFQENDWRHGSCGGCI